MRNKPSTAIAAVKVPPVVAKRAAAERVAGGMQASAKFRLRVTHGDVIAIGPGKIALLEAVGATRSISAAARSIGMSYRRAWILVDQVNSSLKEPAVTSSIGGEQGGGSTLTKAGIELVALYRRIEETAAAACAADLKRLLSLLPK